ncbi:branched-chain amino acid ABC transporter permease [Pararoseomonas indoligenes]|uniref:Branched-chain amino acid ABC transporter permease n=1 Tax=Roseomonas indoligenes TaxID=2820811 RepID=A0A940SA78_9PROT|nr:branched-chain amino acid ABC transporter permease [Pararoseomonas indoligenes]MBP0496078.1 branched-chain amino acid ABC transporter permease [Pararoseomonas indoligenes]
MTENRIVLLLLALAAVLPAFVGDQYVMHLLIMTFFYAMLSTSLNLIVGYVGELSLGHAAFLGLGAYTSAVLSTEAGLPFWLCLPAAGIVAGTAALAVGAITLRLEGHFFVLISLAFAEVLRYVVMNSVELLRGPLGYPNIPAPSLSFGGTVLADFASKAHFYYLGLALLAATLYAAWRFARSSFGLGALAVRENRRLARAVGIDPFRHALVAFVAGGVLAGIAGSFYAHYLTFVGPEVLGFSFTLSALMMVVIGGRGTLLGPLLGAAVVGITLELLRSVNEARLSIFGILLVLAVMFLPDGLVSLRWRRRPEPAEESPTEALDSPLRS